MANWYGLGRTNYFHVKDRPAFDAMLDHYDLGALILSEKDGAVALSGYGFTDDGDVPSWVEAEDGTEAEFWSLIQPHIADGEVLIYQTAGSEKARYVSGSAMAMMNKGIPVNISIDAIYALAADHFKVAINDISQASY